MARYHYREGVTLDKKKSRWFLILMGIIIFAAALYVLIVYLAPQFVSVPFTPLTTDATTQKIKTTKAGQFGDRLYIPQVNVDVAITIGGASDALSTGAWQRNPELGDPTKGGNFVLTAPKFTLDTTPWWTRAKSPFYNLGKLRKGDQLTVDYKNNRYLYQVESTSEAKLVKDIEQKTDSAMLTLYATDGKGETVSGPVVQAKYLGPGQKQTADNAGGFSEE
jgi:LPXTG-site transpeptidase (sortase) family protein